MNDATHAPQRKPRRTKNDPWLILDGFGAERPVVIRPTIIRLYGAPAGILLTQMLYWQRNTRNTDGWFYETTRQLEEQTGLSKQAQLNARKKLVASGVLQEKLSGAPAKMHFKLNLDALAKIVSKGRSFSTHERAKKGRFTPSSTQESSRRETRQLDDAKSVNLQTRNASTEQTPSSTQESSRRETRQLDDAKRVNQLTQLTTNQLTRNASTAPYITQSSSQSSSQSSATTTEQHALISLEVANALIEKGKTRFNAGERSLLEIALTRKGGSQQPEQFKQQIGLLLSDGQAMSTWKALCSLKWKCQVNDDTFRDWLPPLFDLVRVHGLLKVSRAIKDTLPAHLETPASGFVYMTRKLDTTTPATSHQTPPETPGAETPGTYRTQNGTPVWIVHVDHKTGFAVDSRSNDYARGARRHWTPCEDNSDFDHIRPDYERVPDGFEPITYTQMRPPKGSAA